MKVTAIGMVKDEAEIITACLSDLLAQVDDVMILDNCSTDGTRDLIAACAQSEPRLWWASDTEVAYHQGRKMSQLAELARERGADWVLPFDADEVWRSADPERWPTVKSVLEYALAVTGHDLVGGAIYDYLVAGDDGSARDCPNPHERLRWRRRDPVPLPKVAIRARSGIEVAQGNHGAHFHGAPGSLWGFPLMVRHYSNRSVKQFVRKVRNGAAAYAASNLPATMGVHWRTFGAMTDAELAEHFGREFYVERPDLDETLVFDPLA